MRRPLALLGVGVASILLAACGGDGLSADEYRDRLDAACAKLADANAGLPQQAHDEQLDMAEIERRAQHNGEAFAHTIKGLDPPDELQAAHQKLLDRGSASPPPGDDPVAVRRWVLEVADLYHELGAGGCERRQRATARQLPQAS